MTFTDSVRADFVVSLPFIVMLTALMTLDIVFGCVVAFVARKVCSSVSRLGMARKMLMLGSVLVAAVFDGILPAFQWSVFGEPIKMTFAIIVACWWMLTELISITEKGFLLGLPMPKRIAGALERAADALDGAGAKAVSATISGEVEITPKEPCKAPDADVAAQES